MGTEMSSHSGPRRRLGESNQFFLKRVNCSDADDDGKYHVYVSNGQLIMTPLDAQTEGSSEASCTGVPIKTNADGGLCLEDNDTIKVTPMLTTRPTYYFKQYDDGQN